MLNAQLKAWLDRLNELVAEQKAAGVEATPATVRDSMAAMTRNQVRPGPELPWVGDARVECGETPVPVRLYDPAPDRDTPVCLFFQPQGVEAGQGLAHGAISWSSLRRQVPCRQRLSSSLSTSVVRWTMPSTGRPRVSSTTVSGSSA